MAHTTDITVDWGDTDAGGLIYYPRFFHHFVVVGLNDYFTPAVDGGHPMEAYRSDGYLLPAVEASVGIVSLAASSRRRRDHRDDRRQNRRHLAHGGVFGNAPVERRSGRRRRGIVRLRRF